MSTLNTVKQYQFSSVVSMDHDTKEVDNVSSSVEVFSTTVPMIEPTTSIVEKDILTHSNIVDTRALSIKVKHYLKSNQIKWGKFSSLVLVVSQSRLSNLLNNPEPFDSLTRRVQAFYERMDLWMRTKATYGNNPYYKDKNAREVKDRKKRKASVSKKPRSLLDGEENNEMLEALQGYNEAKKLLLIGSGELSLSEDEVSTAQYDDTGTGDTLQKVVEECVITMDTLDYENDEVQTTRVVNDAQEEVSKLVSEEWENYDNDQMGRQGVNEAPLQLFVGECPVGDEREMQASQVFVEGTPGEQGTVAVSTLQESGHE